MVNILFNIRKFKKEKKIGKEKNDNVYRFNKLIYLVLTTQFCV